MGVSKAAKSKSQGREGWCVIFFHPARQDDQGRPLRVRRGLATRDEALADQIVSDLNLLIGDSRWHTPAAKERASTTMHERAVSIFFDSMEPELHDPWSLRELVIPIPGPKQGYCRTLIVGATGAGKTTLARQLLGTDPDRERFPSTSTAKTTVADLEAVLQEGPFRAVVTFFPRDHVRGLVEECVIAAVGAAAESSDENKVAAKLLEHSEQRFRLTYVLGSMAGATEPGQDDGWDDPDESDIADQSLLSVEERQVMVVALRGYVGRCQDVGKRMREALSDSLALDGTKASGSERDAFMELLEEEASKRESGFYTDIQSVVDDIFEAVEERFAYLQGGTLDRTRSGWPSRWTFETQDRGLFIKQVNRFSSNYAPHFGRLLTPLVQGIRVAGPFKPDWLEETPRLVLLDGEGLGHTSDSATSLPTSVTKRFPEVDVIALVDSATQPMLAGPAAVLRTTTAHGHESKLAVVFTRFDEVKGANLPNTKAKMEHVQRSLENTIYKLNGVLASTTVRGLQRHLEGKAFYLAAIDRRLEDIEKAKMREFSTGELRRFIALCAETIRLPTLTHVSPQYDTANLVLCLASATARFQQSWAGRLGVEYRQGVKVEHWTRVKALSRRFAEWSIDQYDDMRPVADLLRELTEGLDKFLATPRGWNPDEAPEDLKQAALESVRQEVSKALHAFTTQKLCTAPLVDWRHAYRLSGSGSGRQRSRDIWDIYSDAAPRLAEVPTPEGVLFLDEVRDLFVAAVKSAGGTVR